MADPTWFHLTARLSPAMPDLARADTGGWLWPRLREAFPTAIASALMPTHPHLLPATRDPDAAAERLARLLGQLGRRFAVDGRASVVKVRAIEDREALKRNLRYIALNPCRDRLVRCPLAWPWSTHRDVVGACVDPWVTSERLAVALAKPHRGFLESFHRYVSGDPSTAVEGTPLPLPASPRRIAAVPLQAVADAVLAATRTTAAALAIRGLPRALFFALALEQGWTQADQLAELGHCRRRLVRALAKTIPPHALAAARLCLGDPRLRMLPRAGSPTDNRMPIGPR